MRQSKGHKVKDGALNNGLKPNSDLRPCRFLLAWRGGDNAASCSTRRAGDARGAVCGGASEGCRFRGEDPDTDPTLSVKGYESLEIRLCVVIDSLAHHAV
ncbi:hypothetical protein RR46_14894 [Papilio xuthus]|uniref:Uncharacterized protein n=1 Tax=Papilio xuthus TaxID=66420 RepID=A0A194PJX2_PAPXU|nr:hypothetical protein RR46_14894 [Papilio xuthus]